ncbi:molecular chaperone GrpE [Chitinophaga sp. YR573]|uniref:nucleotide exchange factor GrpE n=1 Tax=Chitinophaga sp. YR573 TaxID=1881040 RepID=UPI0008C5CE9A|nr:nucleotide exchange factor GrpE [Chitinophaga sp. YR573]SEV98045.1 molecular chaperone GrpE [Chitinophaga sp. YR573]
MIENDINMQTNGQDTENGKDMPNINADENMAGTNHLNDALADESAQEKTQQELDEMRDKYLRLIAEFDNYKKRTAKERVELMQTANKEVIVSLLDVLDDSERATKQLETAADLNAVKDGVMLVFNKLKSTLQNKGLKPMESLHTDFNPDLHEAITEIPAPSKDLQGKVVDDMQKGYYLNDKLIRHARVIVGK